MTPEERRALEEVQETARALVRQLTTMLAPQESRPPPMARRIREPGADGGEDTATVARNIQPAVMSFPETVRYLKTNGKDLRERLRTGVLPGYRLPGGPRKGGQWRIRRDACDAWVEEQERLEEQKRRQCTDA
jgi:hypothetical protein